MTARLTTELRSHADPEAKAATLERFDYAGRYLVGLIIDWYAQEVRNITLRENPRVMRLARMDVGSSIFWNYKPDSRDGRVYIQSPDKMRAREVLRDPKANWRLRMIDGMPVVTRIA